MRKLTILTLVIGLLTGGGLVGQANAGGLVELPKTGQTTCYDINGAFIDCAGTGQDGDIQAGANWPSPRFADHGDGTVTDTLTGLMWLKDGSSLGQGTWQEALDTVADFNSNPDNYDSQDYTANYTDWSLPNVNELESLINAEKTSSTIWLNGQGFADVHEWGPSYWSSNTITATTDQAWYVIISGGNVINASKTHSRYIWAVRAGQSGSAGVSQIWKTGQKASYADGDDGDLQRGVSWPSPRFTDNGDGTVTDNLTGLTWLKDANCFGSKLWQDALGTVADFNSNPDNYDCPDYTATYTEWRLSNRKELRSLIDYSNPYPALSSGHPFANVVFYYWSSTIHAYTTQIYQETRATDYPWYVRMDGYVNGEDGGQMPLPVWPVRTGQTTPDDEDNCPESNLEPTITIDGCDSGVENQLLDDGCTMSDKIAECRDIPNTVTISKIQSERSDDSSLNFNLLEGRVEEPSKVYLFFSVTEGDGKPKHDLTADDFEIYEDDDHISKYESDQTILPAPKVYTMSTVLLLDTSASVVKSETDDADNHRNFVSCVAHLTSEWKGKGLISGSDEGAIQRCAAQSLRSIKSSAESFVDLIAGKDGQEVAIYLFDGREEIKELVAFTKDVSVLKNAIQSMSWEEITSDPDYDDSTNLNGAVKKGLKELDIRQARLEAEQLFTGTMVVFTDGTDQAARVSDSQAVNAVKESSHSAFTIGLGGEIDETHLTNLGKDGFVWAANAGDLGDAFIEIANEIESESKKYYVLGYCSPKRAGNHSVTLQLTGYSGNLTYGFNADNFTPGCSVDEIMSIVNGGNFGDKPLRIGGNVLGNHGIYVKGLSGIEVTLKDGEGTITNGTTDAQGNFIFDGLKSQTYTVLLEDTAKEFSPEKYELDLKASVDGISFKEENSTSCALVAMYGEDSYEVALLRQFRDEVLKKTPIGKELIKLYYEWSPFIVKTMEEEEQFKAEVKETIYGLLPMIR